MARRYLRHPTTTRTAAAAQTAAQRNRFTSANNTAPSARNPPANTLTARRKGGQEAVQCLIEEQRRGADPRDAFLLVVPCADYDFLAALPAQHHEGRPRLLDERRRMRDTFGEELLRARQHVGRRERDRRRMDHGVGRIVMPVGCRGTGMLATRARVVRSMTSTAPGSIPTLSCETKAQRPSGEYATPWGNDFEVGILATSVRLCASTSDTLCAFLFVTMIQRPSADGSTL